MDKFVKKAAVFSILMLGQVSYSPTDSYFENDPDFNSVSAKLLTGWSWGFNRAHAYCNDSSAPPDCYTTYGSNPGGNVPNPGNGGGNETYDYDDYSDNSYQEPNWDEYVGSPHFLMCQDKFSNRPGNCTNFYGNPYDRV